jgi:hypothetical protein
METALPFRLGGVLGRISETVFCSFETAAAHAEDREAVEQKVRPGERIFRASIRERHREQMELARGIDDVVNECVSRRKRAFNLGGGIDQGVQCRGIEVAAFEILDFFGTT